MQVTQWILELVDRITSPLHAATDAAEEATRVIDDTEEVVERLGETSGKAAGKLEGVGKRNVLSQPAERRCRQYP